MENLAKFLILAVLQLVFLTTNAQYNGFRDLPGPYCRIRTGGSHCCDGRVDECSVPLFGTLCYCDQFCDRTTNPDCCPDYWEVCRGVPRPSFLTSRKTCPHDGGTLAHKQKTKINCNQCECDDGTLSCESGRCLIDELILDQLGEASDLGDLGWTFANHSAFWGQKLKEGMKRLTGTFTPGVKSLRMHPIKLHYDIADIPTNFDARQKWRGLSAVRDQGWCGASWAFSSLAVAEDRLTIASDGFEQVSLSPQHLISCNRRGQQACRGGHVERAWNFLRRRGVSPESCYPYESGHSGIATHCKHPEKKIHTLRDVCAKEDLLEFARESLFTTEPAYRIASKEHDIMWEIMTNGPVQALMRVYQDFFLYSGGVYSRRSLQQESGDDAFHVHSVKLLGWGEEHSRHGGKENYWLAQNSWGKTWGEEGYFRIRRGTNESDIEQFILAVRTHLADDEANQLRRRRRRF